jgi:uncharacterized protein (TIGR03435 family)
MRRLACAAAVAALAVLQGLAQPPRPAFDVVSVKPSKSTDFRSLSLNYYPGGRFSARNVPMFMLIGEAYHVAVVNESVRLSGVPDWGRSERFDVEAVPRPGGIPPGLTSEAGRSVVRVMLQALLRDRFSLAVRSDKKDLPVYALVVSEGGPRLRKTAIEENDCSQSEIPCHHFSGGQDAASTGRLSTCRTSWCLSRITRTGPWWIKRI